MNSDKNSTGIKRHDTKLMFYSFHSSRKENHIDKLRWTTLISPCMRVYKFALLKGWAIRYNDKKEKNFKGMYYKIAVKVPVGANIKKLYLTHFELFNNRKIEIITVPLASLIIISKKIAKAIIHDFIEVTDKFIDTGEVRGSDWVWYSVFCGVKI